MSLTVEQKIARKEAELARLKEKARKLENGQKIIIGGMILSMAKDNPKVSNKLLEWINENVTRQTDLKRLESVIQQLKKTAKSENQQHDNVPNNEIGVHHGL